MSTLSTFVACNSVQESLINAWGYDNNKINDVVLLRFLMSGINKNDTINTSINFRPNGLRDYVVTYGQRFIESDTTAGGGISCDTGSPDGITSTTYTIDPTDGVHHVLSFTQTQLQTMCEANPSFLAKELKKQMDVIVRKMETDLVTSLLANTGNFASDVVNGDPAGTTSVVNGATLLSGGGISTNFLQNVAYQSGVNEMGMPYVFGGEKLSNYAAALGAACCGDIGLDAGVYATNAGIRLAYSTKVAMGVADPDDCIAVVPGAVQMLDFNQFIGGSGNVFTVDDGALKQGILVYPDATLPIVFDYRAELTCVEGVQTWTFEVAKNYAYIYLPSDMYKSGDILEGVNGVNLYNITNP